MPKITLIAFGLFFMKQENQPFSAEDLWNHPSLEGSDTIRVIHPVYGTERITRVTVKMGQQIINYRQILGAYVNPERLTITLAFRGSNGDSKYATYRCDRIAIIFAKSSNFSNSS